MDPAYHGARYMDPDFRCKQNGYDYPQPHPQDTQEAIQRGIETERIREEIIMSEIVRRRVLEAEVRRELTVEREMALLQGRDGFPFDSEIVRRRVLEAEVRRELMMEREMALLQGSDGFPFDSEIVRRRVLEAEVRRELMMEKEMALLQGRDGFPFSSSPVMGLETPTRPSLLVTKAEGWSSEERLGLALEDKEKLRRSENGGLETFSFQRGTADLRISEIKPASEGNVEKERILLLTKPDENVSGLKTKDETPPEVFNMEHLADVIANKISKEEWSCALCQFMAPCEKDLNEHVLGKKHVLKVAALRARRTRKNYRIGLFPKKPTQSIHVKEKGVKLKVRSLLSRNGGKATSKKDNLPLSQNPKSEHLKKTQAEVIQKVQKNENDPRKKGCKFSEIMNTHKSGNIELPADVIANKKYEEWRCALCQVIATSEKDLNAHVLGKNHKSKVAALRTQRTGENRSIGLFPKKLTKSIHVKEKGVKLKVRSLFSRRGKATSKKDDLPLSQNSKSEHLKKNQVEVIQKVQKNENDPRKKGCKFSEIMNAHKSGNIELPADVIANKKSEEEWRCALCQVKATSEKDLNVHVLGKNHKSKVAALGTQRTGENRSIGLFPKKPTKSIHVKEKGVKLKARSFCSQKGGKAASDKDDLPLSQNPKSEHLKKTQAEVIQNDQKNENDRRKKGCKFSEIMNVHKSGNIELPADVIANKKSEEWRCALCQVIASSENNLNAHVLGKKHKSKVAELRTQRTGEYRSIGLSPKKPAKSIDVEGVKLKAQSLFTQKGGKATSKKDDLPLTQNPKSGQKLWKATSKKDDLPLSQNPKSEHLKKTQAEVIRNVQKNKNDPREKGCNSERGLNEHVRGKKHKLKEAALRSS